ncbi:hypothetical protein SDC9_123623 [bioreactor metagenome]|uniref:Uncharacterized protein n=1 Tax=bioreactor metagenome TaxID=1076179 RepID=A0A645CI90_9ZZZZ
MEDVIYAVHGVLDAVYIAHVADVEFYLLVIVIFGAHVVLFLLVAGEDAEFFYVRRKETVEDRVTERTRAARD